MAEARGGERLLVVEDDEDQRRLVCDILRAEGFQVAEAATVGAARAVLAASPVDVVISDWQLPDGDGLELLSEIRQSHTGTAFLMVTAYGTIARAVDAVRAGADDYLTKPFERQALLMALARTLRARRLVDENRRLSEALEDRERLVDLMGSAPSMRKLFRRVEKLAGTDATVLLTGESGTGKELAARALHVLSQRATEPFVVVNCAAVPEALMEAEFFGARKGAYTGADRHRDGKFQAAQGGTLFLDEVGELPMAVQPKLLRALQGGHITPVGGTEEMVVDVRILAATNRDLQAEVQSGGFREDLFYRLNVIPVHMPALRERREDIPILISHFRDRAERRHGLRAPSFPASLMKKLVDYAWPGNVRELENVVERLVLLADDDQVSEEDLPQNVVGRPPGKVSFQLPPGGLAWEAHERDCLGQALAMAGGNRARAARYLDMPYKAFLYRLEKHGLGVDEG